MDLPSAWDRGEQSRSGPFFRVLFSPREGVVLDELARRIAVLEVHTSAPGIGSDMRVIEMQIARAEEKVLRLGRASSWTHPALGLLITENS